MPMIYSNDARMMNHELKNQGDYRDTYSAFEGLRTRAFDPGRLCDHPRIDWDWPQLLKTPLSMILISHFLVNFATFVLPVLAASNPYFRVPLLLMYDTRC